MTIRPALPEGQPLARAVNFAITQMKKRRKYFSDGRLAIDDNASECAVKNVILGRKNYLFFWQWWKVFSLDAALGLCIYGACFRQRTRNQN